MSILDQLTDLLRQNYNTVASVRTAILMTGLGMDPEDGRDLLKAAIACSKNIDPLVPAAESRDWHLYIAVTDLECPIHCIMMAPWLVNAILEVHGIKEENEYPFHKLDPAVWTAGLKDVWAKFPDAVKTEETNDLIEAVLEGAERVSEGDLNQMRVMLKRKGEAIAARHEHSSARYEAHRSHH